MHGGGAYKSSNHVASKKAFTLAEVLITLAIIGVVAALTIPTVVAKYQKKQYYTQFMKTYNIITNVVSMAVAENGEIDTWGLKFKTNEDELFEKNILPYLKVAKKITESDSDYTVTLSYMNGAQYSEPWSWADFDGYLLEDGSIVSIGLNGSRAAVYATFDTNGIKGPNVFGRDVFIEGYSYQKLADGKYISIPRSMLKDTDDGPVLKTREELNEEFFGDDSEYNCTADKKGGEFNCASRLLLEGKMDY